MARVELVCIFIQEQKFMTFIVLTFDFLLASFDCACLNINGNWFFQYYINFSEFTVIILKFGNHHIWNKETVILKTIVRSFYRLSSVGFFLHCCWTAKEVKYILMVYVLQYTGSPLLKQHCFLNNTVYFGTLILSI